MRHRRYFPGKGIFWIFILIFLFGGMGKNGFPGFLFPLILFWFIGPLVISVSKRSRHRPNRVERVREPRRQPQPVSFSPPQVRREPVVRPAVRSLAGVPTSCRSCGGPANEITVEWRGSRQICGFCGSGF